MAKETFDGKVTWYGNGKSVALTGLTREQMEQVIALIKASGAGASWELLAHHHTPPATLGDRINALWRRLNAWMAPLLVLGLLSVPAMAQELGPRAVEPARVSFADDSTATVTDREFNELLRAEMKTRATIRFTSSRFDYKVLTATAPITSKGKLSGFAVAVGVLAPGPESKELSLKLHITIGPTLDALAKDVGAFLDKELQRPRRRR